MLESRHINVYYHENNDPHSQQSNELLKCSDAPLSSHVPSFCVCFLPLRQGTRRSRKLCDTKREFVSNFVLESVESIALSGQGGSGRGEDRGGSCSLRCSSVRSWNLCTVFVNASVCCVQYTVVHTSVRIVSPSAACRACGRQRHLQPAKTGGPFRPGARRARNELAAVDQVDVASLSCCISFFPGSLCARSRV